MASSSSSPPLLALPVTEKLSKSNFVVWQAQVMPAIRGAQLESHLNRQAVVPPMEISAQVDSKTVKQANPDYVAWVAKDQQVLSYLLTSMTREVMAQVTTHTTAAAVWAAVEVIFSSQTRAHAMNTHIALAKTQKGNLSMPDYIAKMKTYVDDMAAAGKPLEDDDVVSYVLTGLDPDYNPIVTSVLTRAEPIRLDEFFSQLLSFEMHLDMQHHGHHGGSSSANMASRANGRGRGFRGRGRGPSQGQAKVVAVDLGGDAATTTILAPLTLSATTPTTAAPVEVTAARFVVATITQLWIAGTASTKITSPMRRMLRPP